jgi:hypothetical protein
MRLDKPKNIEEAVSIVMDAMSNNQKKHLHQTREENLIDEHFGFGLWVRNFLGHWVPTTDGGGYPTNPDDISGDITRIVWKKLRQGL